PPQTAPPNSAAASQATSAKPVPAPGFQSAPVPPPPNTASTATTPLPPPPVPVAPPKDVPKPKVEPAHAAAPAVALKVIDGLPFQIALAENVPANVQEGREISFRAKDDLKVDDTIVVLKGATVTGTITGEAGKKFLGIGSSKLNFQLNT